MVTKDQLHIFQVSHSFYLLEGKDILKCYIYFILDQVCQLDFLLKVYESLTTKNTIDARWIKKSKH